MLLSSLAFGDPYQILGVSPTASKEEILQAYRQKAKSYHPDVSSLPAAEAAREFKKIQSAYEEIQRGGKPKTQTSDAQNDSDRRKEIEKQQAKTKATKILEDHWERGTFNAETIRSLPVFSELSPTQTFRFGRGPHEDGEWEAISAFLKTHQEDFLRQNRDPREINEILKAIDYYSEYTGLSIKDIRNGLTAPFEQAVLEKTNDRDLFLEALEDKLYRLTRSGAISPVLASKEERKQVLGPISEIFARKFGSQTDSGESPTLQLARATMNSAFSKIEKSPARLHELDFLIKSLPQALEPQEQLLFLSGFLGKLEWLPKNFGSKGALNDLKTRAENRIQRVLEKEPELQKLYAEKGSLWNRLTGKATLCEIRLGKLAKKPRD